MKLGMKLGQVLGQIQYKGTTSLNMSQYPTHDLGKVLGLILGQRKCLLNCTPGRLGLVLRLEGVCEGEAGEGGRGAGREGAQQAHAVHR